MFLDVMQRFFIANLHLAPRQKPQAPIKAQSEAAVQDKSKALTRPPPPHRTLVGCILCVDFDS